MKIHFLKTVWSDMIILEKKGQYALVDTGFDEQYDQLKSYLDQMGVKEIAFILLTHFHRDHYGNIEKLVKDYDVKKVFFKEYGGHDVCTAWGSVADDSYRESEKEKWRHMKECILEHSKLIMVETLETIDFDGLTLYLYSTENHVQKMWDDETNEETYHKNVMSENENSLAVFFTCHGKNVFLGGDTMDHEAVHLRAHFVNLQIAKKINQEIYLYKAPHHGTNHTACEETLQIYRPKVAVITNGMEWLSQYDTMDALKKVNPDVEILLTEDQDVVVEV